MIYSVYNVISDIDIQAHALQTQYATLLDIYRASFSLHSLVTVYKLIL